MRDLGVGEAVRDQAEDLLLTRGEFVELLGRGGTRDTRELLDDAFGDRGGEQRVSGGDSADRGKQLFGAQWEASIEDEATPVCGPCGHLAAIDLDALADPDEAVAAAVGRGAAHAVVAHLELHLAGQVPDGHVGFGGAGVLERVRQAFLDDAIGGEVDASRERNRLAVDVQLDGEPGAADLLSQRRTKLTGFAAAAVGALIGARLGFNATEGLLAVITTIVGAAAGGNLTLVALDIAWDRQLRDRFAATRDTGSLEVSRAGSAG